VKSISEEALRILSQHDWPGNVRQLESAIEWAAISCDGETIEPHHLPGTVRPKGFSADTPVPRTNDEFLRLKKRLREEAVADLEREFAIAALERNGWNVSRAAQEVGIARPNFQAIMRKHNIRHG
jgi:DNA-binding NtrC family response regulator